MNMPTRLQGLQAYQLLLYKKPLHPELFALKTHRLLRKNRYEVESWVAAGGHLISFHHAGFTCCELLVNQEGNLPLEGAVTAIPVAGEHDFTHSFQTEKVSYVTSIQTETLSENIYASMLEEMTDFAKTENGLVHAWQDADAAMGNLSLLDIQRMNKEVHVQSYHLMAAGGVVIRTQTIFEHQ